FDALLAWCRRGGAGNPSSGIRITCRCPSEEGERQHDVSQECVDDARRALDGHRRHTAELLSSLTALAKAMTPLPGPKAIVLVSEGLFADPLTRDSVAEFAQEAE